MYYLVIMNLDVEKCIDTNEVDIYRNGQSWDCSQEIYFGGGERVKKILINCTDPFIPGIPAIVYRD
jgi:hypothetical protein